MIETTPAPTPAPKRTHSSQSQKVSNAIALLGQYGLALSNDAALTSLFEAEGVEADRRTALATLHQNSQAAYDDCQQKIANRKQASGTYQELNQTARQDASDYRKAARVVLPDPAARTALHLNDRLSEDLQKFTTDQRTSYGAALANPAYLAALATVGYSETRIQTLMASIDDLQSAYKAFNTADGDAQAATATRDQLMSQVTLELRKLDLIAERLIRAHPDIAARLPSY